MVIHQPVRLLGPQSHIDIFQQQGLLQDGVQTGKIQVFEFLPDMVAVVFRFAFLFGINLIRGLLFFRL